MKNYNILLFLLIIFFLSGCKVSISNFEILDSPDGSAIEEAETGTVISLRIDGKSEYLPEYACNMVGIAVQIPDTWQVLSAIAYDQENNEYLLAEDADFASIYTPEAGHQIWSGVHSFFGKSGDHNLVVVIKVVTASFSGTIGETADFSIKISGGAYRADGWEIDDPVSQSDFSAISDDKYVETISLTEAGDDNSPPTNIRSDLTLFYSGVQGDNSIIVDWSTYDEDAKGDVVGYRVYYSTEEFTNVTGVTYEEVAAGTFSKEIDGLLEGQQYYFAVTAIDEAGNEQKQFFTSASFYTGSQPNIWDVEGDGKVGLKEAIQALQIVSGSEN